MRWVILVASLIMQTCIGGLYAWSEFVGPLRGLGLTSSQTQLIFGVLIATFTSSMVLSGRLLGRFGPLPVALLGGFLFGLGYWLASLSGGDFFLLLLGIGIIAGIGTGFCYVCPLTMCAKWFPAHKGLVTGVAVAGFGGGAVVLASLAEHLLGAGLDVLGVFRRVGLFYGGLIMLCALPLRFPAGGIGQAPPLALGLLRRDRHFWALALAMFAGTFSGLLVIGNLKPLVLSKGLDASHATAAVSAFAIGNAAGRIGWGWAADHLRAWAIPLSATWLALALLLSLVMFAWPIAAVLAAGLIGFGFGACFSVYAAQTSSHYGIGQLGAVYPLVFLAYGLSGLAGPWLGGWLYDRSGSYTGGLIVAIIVVCAGAAWSCRLLRVDARARGMLPGRCELKPGSSRRGWSPKTKAKDACV